MQFEIPGYAPDQYEDVLIAYAQICSEFMGRRVQVPAPSELRRSITFQEEDGSEWTAAVGQTLRGEKTERRQVSGRMKDVTASLSNSATVMAIFPGDPALVITDGRGKPWSNPFEARSISASVTFDPPPG